MVTEVEMLDGAGRREELARMLGGGETALRHADELLRGAGKEGGRPGSKGRGRSKNDALAATQGGDADRADGKR